MSKLRICVISAILFLGFALSPVDAAGTPHTWVDEGATWGGDTDNERVSAMEEYKNKLYVGTINPSPLTGAQIWSYNGWAWNAAVPAGFGDTNNTQIADLVAWDGNLVASTYNPISGAEVKIYDGSSWTTLGAAGLGDSNNYAAYAVIDFYGDLYVGYDNNTTGVEIWKTDGSSWTRVNIDGFGDVNNTELSDFAIYDTKLYVGVTNGVVGARVYKYTGSQWNIVNTNGFGDVQNVAIDSMAVVGDKLYAATTNNNTGTEVWRYNGSSWKQVNANGFGTATNVMSPAMIAYDDSLYVGTYNSVNGAEIWKRSGTSWTQSASGGFGSVNNNLLGAFESYQGRLFAGVGDLIGTNSASVKSNMDLTTLPVYRFWSDNYRHHFYTISESEKNYVINNLSHDWKYEKVAFRAMKTEQNDLSPVYRFWSDKYHGHFYTISESEKNYVINNLSHDWKYEGVAYYAADSEYNDVKPLYRFWSDKYKGHFYTRSSSERDSVINNLSHDWKYEGTRYYVF